MSWVDYDALVDTAADNIMVMASKGDRKAVEMVLRRVICQVGEVDAATVQRWMRDHHLR